ncbi:MAG: prephenate dehydratase [Deltaproteobacteria bacterium]|nr:prephenate dehydratase [Deltaproteobacteria bacterium]
MKKSAAYIKDLRADIDSIDSKILRLLNKRAMRVIGVGRAKSMGKMDFYAPDRESEIYARLTGENKGPFPNQALRNVFREIMSASLSLEKPLRVAFLGPVATFTHQACIQHFGLSGEFAPKKEIADVFDDVEKGRADFGVVPIENTTEGVVSHTLDLFVSSELKICAEVMLGVSLAIMNKTGALGDVKKVSSHPHALAECKRWLKENLDGAVQVEVSSTAMAAQLAAEDGAVAAIASVAAADIYGLRLIEKGVEDNANNYTRFLVIGEKACKRTGADKTSLVFAVKDRPGALYSMLKPFAKRRINLTKIESRPLKTKAWEYLFFVDLDGHIGEKKVHGAVSELLEACSFLKVLGSYPKSQAVK